MALTAAQIVTLACQTAKGPGFTAQAGVLLNSTLSYLCQTYDFDVIRKTFAFNFSSATGSGPYALPADYLRSRINDVFYTISGVPYVLISIELAEYDRMVQQAGLASYPEAYATDLSTSPPGMLVWPPSSGAYPVTVRYSPQMADIATPETSSVVPWFPNSDYLIRKVAADVMLLTDDDRQPLFEKQAEGVLNHYLQLKDDKSGRAQRVQLDRRQFGPSFDRLPNTKMIGW